MGEATKILRSSIHAFFHDYPSFISIATLFFFPFSASFLLSQSLISSSSSPLHSFIASRIRSLFESSLLPSSSPLFTPLHVMLSQTLFSSIFSLPFTLTFLLLAKASVILLIHYNRYPPPFSSLLTLYPSLLSTQIFNPVLIISAGASILALLCFAFGAVEFMGFSPSALLSSVGAVVYSIVIAHTVVVSNLAVTVSAMEECSGYLAVIRACGLIKGRVVTALSIALPANLAMAAVEALFQYRVVRLYRLSSSKKLDFSIASEAFTITLLHSLVIVVETIAGYLFYKSCKRGCGENLEGGFSPNSRESEPEEKGEV